MPMYCYRDGDDVICRHFAAHRPKPKRIRHNGRTYVRSPEDEWSSVSVPASAGWPMECLASGVHSSQAQELRDYYRKHGVPTEVTADGNPIYRNAAHRRKALKVRGFRDNASFY